VCILFSLVQHLDTKLTGITRSLIMQFLFQKRLHHGNIYFRHSDDQKQVASRVLTSLDPTCETSAQRESRPEDRNENGQAVAVAFVISTLETTTSDVVPD